MPLARPGLLHTSPDGCRCLAGGLAQQLPLGEPRHHEPDVDPIEQRPRQLLSVQLHAVRRTPALTFGIPFVATRARVGGSDEREPRRELNRPGHPRHHDAAVLERLAEGLHRIAPELRQLVEEQDPVMRERDLPRPDEAGPPTEERRQGDGVMRRPEWPRPHQPSRVQHAGHGMKLRDLQGLSPGKAGEDGGEAPRQHGLARAR